MFGTAQRAINAYTNVGIETGVEAADPHKLILMLYEGALLALVEAKRSMTQNDIAAKGKALSKAIMIIEHGLKASLDVNAGGELGERLGALYDYMAERLLQANLHNRAELIDEVSRLLTELRGAWEQIRPGTVPAPQSQQSAPPARPGVRVSR
jgi:flagellar secretion chaperone FliS